MPRRSLRAATPGCSDVVTVMFAGSARLDLLELGRPLRVRHTFAALAEAVGRRGLPERDLVEVLDAVRLATRGPEQVAALTGTRHDRNRAEPCRRTGLRSVAQRPLHPLVRAVRVRRVGAQHRRVGPTGRTLL